MTALGPVLPWGAAAGAAPVDVRVTAALNDLAAEHGPLVPLETYRGDPLVAVGHGVVVHVALGETAAAELSREAASRRWARAAGVRVPDWELLTSAETETCTLISARVRSDPGTEPAYAEAAVVASRAVQSASAAPPEGGRTWRASRRTRPRRIARATLSPLRLRETRRLRNAVASLPADGWAHGDFRSYNVLYDTKDEQVHLIDWEYVGRAWRGSDLLALWACLDQPEVADVLLDAVLADRGAAEAPDVGLVLLWSSVRILAEQVTGCSIREREPARIARVAARVDRARALARELGTVVP